MWRVTEYKEKETYENSYKYVTERKYPAALQAFKEYLAQYPNGTYAANAHYWIGEVYAAQWQANRNNQELINNALASFKTVVKDFPKHQKAQDALLKLGIVEADLQHVDAARGYLSKVIQQYPNTSSARIAQNKLNQLAQIGH
jgi:tol-pal system protein YbgF